MLSEHEGDRLLDIAREEAIAADSLRQRICRLRRDLRARFLVALIAVLFLGGSGGALTRAARGPSEPPLAAAMMIRAYDGTWRVVGLTTATGRAAPLETRVVITGNDVRVLGPAGALLRAFSATVDGDQIALAAGGTTRLITVRSIDADHLVIEGAQGSARLKRER